jgi:acetyltransferase-like isoleucine patch superfamily enzyme
VALKSLNQLRRLRNAIIALRKSWLALRTGAVLHPSASISLSSRIRCGARGSVVVGAETLIAFKTLIYSLDGATGAVLAVSIGRRCFIGGGSVITPGVTIGDESIVAAGAVVLSDVPPRSIVAGNPARILRSDIVVGPFGRLEGADENTRRMWTLD